MKFTGRALVFNGMLYVLLSEPFRTHPNGWRWIVAFWDDGTVDSINFNIVENSRELVEE